MWIFNMKRKLLLLFVLPLLSISACHFQTTPISFENNESNSIQEISSYISKSVSSDSKNVSSEENISKFNPSSSRNISSSNRSSSKDSSNSNKSIITSNSKTSSGKYTLEEWTNWKFYDDYGPIHNSDWEYLYGTSINPNGVLFTTPNDEHTGDGIIFEDKTKQSLTSPLFQAWKKVEVRFKLWFSNKTGKKYF